MACSEPAIETDAKMSHKDPACEDSVASRTRSKADKQLHVWQGEYDYRRTCDDEKNSLTATGLKGVMRHILLL